MKNNLAYLRTPLFERRMKYDGPCNENKRIPYITLQEGEYDLLPEPHFHKKGGAFVKVSDGIINEITYIRDLTYTKDIIKFEKLLKVDDYWLGLLASTKNGSCYSLYNPMNVAKLFKTMGIYDFLSLWGCEL